MWHAPCGITVDNHEDMVSKYSLISLHPIEVARQITLLTHHLVSQTTLNDLRTKKSAKKTMWTNFVDRNIFYLQGVLVTTKSGGPCG